MPEVFQYAIRFDNQSSEKLVQFLSKDGGAYLVVKELEDSNPHFHAVLHSSRNVSAIRTAFRKQVLDGEKGNGAYSITSVKDLDKYERYMCKGGSEAEPPHVVSSNGLRYTTDWVASTHQRYWVTNAELLEKRAKLSTVDAVTAACKDAHVDWKSKEKIAELYIRELVRRDKPINTFSVKASIQLIQCRLCPDDSAILDLAAHCL